VRLLKRLHQWDVLRANKAPFAWGVETRVPFLDKAFLDLVMNIDPQEKMVRCCNRKSPWALQCRTKHCISLATGCRLLVWTLQCAKSQ
jgi:asparagine synthetase B (glutamine-hydrolysing)